MTLAAWLRAGRDRRKLTIEDVAKITKIQVRILEKLEKGQLDGLPAEVFVKGFVRSFAKCVGLDEAEALDKYSAAQAQPIATKGTAQAFVETLARPIDLDALLEARRVSQTPSEPTPAVPVEASIETSNVAPVEAPLVIEAPIEIETPVVEPAVAVEAAPANKQKKKDRARKNAKQRNRKRKQAQEQKLAAQDAIETAVFEPVESIEICDAIEKIETAPVASISFGDGESLEATSIEAKTNDAIVDAPVATSVSRDAAGDAIVEAAPLAEGSGRISQHEIAVLEQEIVSALDNIANGSRNDASELVASDASEAVTSDVSALYASDASTSLDANDEPLPTGTWQPTMPPIVTTPSVPWRRPSLPRASTSGATYVVPSLVIDDADPDSADRERDDRAAKEPHRLSFLPPILMDREDRSARQGGLTLAVIILLIAATLTLSYLMRRPSPSGDGVTMSDTPATLQA